MTPISPSLLAECAAYLRARASVEPRVYVPSGALAGAEAEGRAPSRAAASPRPARVGPPVEAEPTLGTAPSFVRSLPTEALPSAPLTQAAGAPLPLSVFHEEIKDCLRCALGHTRTKFVFGVGNPSADLMLVGEAPGREEDLQGIPFVGAAGQLLTKMLAAIGLSRDEVYIANVLKCRPPGNRDPEPDEIASCRPYLEEQIRLIGPRLLLALGRFSSHLLTGREASLSQLRGLTYHYGGIPVIPSYHPSALLRNPALKRPAWDDLKRVRAELEVLGPRAPKASVETP